MSDMLEEAARALADHFGCEWETMRDEDRSMIRGYCRAVLLAIREPDNRTVFKAGRLSNDTSFKGLGRLTVTHTAMIDAILAEETGT